MERKTQILERILNILVLTGSVAILAVLSIEMLPETRILTNRFINNFHLAICTIFLVDFFVRLHYSPRHLHFFIYNFLFLLVSVPYLTIIDVFQIHTDYYTNLIARFVPLIRGIYGIAIMIGWITRSRMTNLFISYISTILITTYFASIIFYSIERGVNPMIKNYWDSAITWACMNVTTVGSDIFAVTRTGQVLSVFLAASGMLMFPIFTAYITQRFQGRRKKDDEKPK